MKKLLFLIILILALPIAFAHMGEEVKDFSEAKALIDAGTNCDNLTEEQLEEIGEYMMERMHPGEAHEQMHESMELVEGTEAEENFHINMAKSMYCQQGGMNMAMGMDMGMNSGMGSNMMGYSYGAFGFLWMLLGLVLFVGAAILIWLLVVKFWRELKNKRRNS